MSDTASFSSETVIIALKLPSNQTDSRLDLLHALRRRWAIHSRLTVTLSIANRSTEIAGEGRKHVFAEISGENMAIRWPKNSRFGKTTRHRPVLELLESRQLLSFLPPVNYSTSNDPNNVAAADFNGDGAATWPFPTAMSVMALPSGFV